jgi:Uma2 family endonuclease/DNA-binding transcriptional regulator YdaS (Cro superfamily)
MTTALQLAIKLAGGQTALAARIGRTQGHVSKWLERNFIPPDAVLPIENATGISRHELRPDIYPAEDYGFQESSNPITSKQLIGQKWTVAEIDALEQAGLLIESDRFELIDGEIVPMNAKGALHEHYKASLNLFWMRNSKNNYRIAQETTFRMSPQTYVEPDFVFYDSNVKLPQLAPANTLLAVEVSDTTLKFDRGRKAEVYASFGIKALWVINVNTLDTHIFSQPEQGSYKSTKPIGPSEILAPDFAPELAMKLGQLELI